MASGREELAGRKKRTQSRNDKEGEQGVVRV